MIDLTEKLKAGELYYVKKKNGKIVIRQSHLYSCLRTENSMPFVDFEDNDIDKVLASVPSYKEYQRLKEILYKCREKLDELDYGCEIWAGELTGFIEEINQAIGEKK